MYSKTGYPLAIQCTSAENLLKQQRLDTEHTFEETWRTSSYVLRLVKNLKYGELLKCILLYQINGAKGVLLSWLSFVKSCVPFILILQSDVKNMYWQFDLISETQQKHFQSTFATPVNNNTASSFIGHGSMS